VANQAYFPKASADKIVWLNNYMAKLKAHADQVGLSADQLAASLAGLMYYLWILQYWYPAMLQNALEATAYRDLIAMGNGSICRLPTPVSCEQAPAECPPGVLPRLFNEVQRIKLSKGYTESIGQDLGIIGKLSSASYAVPDYSLVLDRGDDNERVNIPFTKHGHDGVYIESRRNNGEWEFLAIVMSKPYYDERPLFIAGTPEVREYRIRYWDDGATNGNFAPIQKITVGP